MALKSGSHSRLFHLDSVIVSKLGAAHYDGEVVLTSSAAGEFEMSKPKNDNLSYSENQRAQAAENGVYDKLAILRQKLMNEGGFEVSVLDDRFSQDPTIWVGGFSPALVIQVKMQLNGDKVVLNFRPKCPNPHSPGKAAKEALETALRGTPYTSRNNGAYAPLADFKTNDGYPGGIPWEDVSTITKIIRDGIGAVVAK